MRYRPEYRAGAKWLLTSSDLARVLWLRARQGVHYARSIAPHGRGTYKAGIRVQDGPVRPARGRFLARQTVLIHATAPHSAAVEWGNKGSKRFGRVPARHVMKRTARAIHDPRRGP